MQEIKRHLDGRREVFACQALVMKPHLAIVRFVSSQGRRAGGIEFPAGAITYGFFWRWRPYDLYRMVDPQGRLLAHRLDAVDEVRIRPEQGEVEYLDLLLDIWAYPDGNVRVEDEDEVADYAQRGLISSQQQARIERTRDYVVRARGRIMAEAQAMLADLVHRSSSSPESDCPSCGFGPSTT